MRELHRKAEQQDVKTWNNILGDEEGRENTMVKEREGTTFKERDGTTFKDRDGTTFKMDIGGERQGLSTIANFKGQRESERLISES